MAPTLFNESDVDQVENFNGHVEILDGATWYKFDTLLSWSIFTRFDTEKHYSTNGAKKKTTIGDSSTYEIRVKRTADLYDTNDPSTEKKSISYFKQLGYTLPRKLPTISLRGVSESNASSDQFIVDEFTATVENIDEVRDEGKGVEEVTISGEILTHSINDRRTSAP